MADTQKYFLELEGLQKYDALIKQHIPLVWTKAYYDEHCSTFVPKNGQIVIIQNYREKDGKTIAAIKIGDGTTTLQNCLFFDTFYWDHINDTDIHITSTEREKWNNKLSDVTIDDELMNFTKD